MAKLTDILNGTAGRVTALENDDINDNAGVFRITKTYLKCKIRIAVNARLYTYLSPSTSLYPTNSTYGEVEL